MFLPRSIGFGIFATASLALGGFAFAASGTHTKLLPANLRPLPAATVIVGSSAGPLFSVQNNGSSPFDVFGVLGIAGNGPYSIGVLGFGANPAAPNLALTGYDIGPGSIGSVGEAVFPEQSGGPTSSNQTTGVFGIASNGDGVMGQTSVQHGSISIVSEAAVSGYAGIVGVDDTNNHGSNSGVVGQTTNGLAGVEGVSGDGASAGVEGVGTNGDGVFGDSTSGAGVHASSTNSTALFATSESGYGVVVSNTGNEAAIAAQNVGTADGIDVSSLGTGDFGVYGLASGTNGIGVRGLGQAAGGEGVWGVGSNVGLVGQAEFTGSKPLQLLDATGNTLAYVDSSGNLYLKGTVSPLVAARGGGVGRAYDAKSTMQTMEDFGSGELLNGSGVVHLDPSFVRMIDGTGYQVFLTAEGDNRGLYVTEKTPGSFVVRECQGGRSSLAFDYRIVARQNGHTSDRASIASSAVAFGERQISAPPLRSALQLPRNAALMKHMSMSAKQSHRSSYNTFAIPRAISGLTLNFAR